MFQEADGPGTTGKVQLTRVLGVLLPERPPCPILSDSFSNACFTLESSFRSPPLGLNARKALMINFNDCVGPFHC